MTNFNRVLVIPTIRMEDEGEYICRINNDQSIKEASITLHIQGNNNLFELASLVQKCYIFRIYLQPNQISRFLSPIDTLIGALTLPGLAKLSVYRMCRTNGIKTANR